MLAASRPIPPQVTDADLQTILDLLNAGFDRTAARLRCPDHGTVPKVVFGADRRQGISYEALVCCPTLDDLVFAHVRRHLIEHPVGDWRYGGE